MISFKRKWSLLNSLDVVKGGSPLEVPDSYEDEVNDEKSWVDETEWYMRLNEYVCTSLLKQTYSYFKSIKKVLYELIFKIMLILFLLQLSQVSQVLLQTKYFLYCL